MGSRMLHSVLSKHFALHSLGHRFVPHALGLAHFVPAHQNSGARSEAAIGQHQVRSRCPARLPSHNADASQTTAAIAATPAKPATAGENRTHDRGPPRNCCSICATSRARGPRAGGTSLRRQTRTKSPDRRFDSLFTRPARPASGQMIVDPRRIASRKLAVEG